MIPREREEKDDEFLKIINNQIKDTTKPVFSRLQKRSDHQVQIIGECKINDCNAEVEITKDNKNYNPSNINKRIKIFEDAIKKNAQENMVNIKDKNNVQKQETGKKESMLKNSDKQIYKKPSNLKKDIQKKLYR